MTSVSFPAWDPVFLDLPGPFDLRWYGLSYLVAFGIAQFGLKRLARAKFLPMEPDAVFDLVFWSILGTILGGRLGYAAFYKPELFGSFTDLIAINEGGLAFHGGMLGVTTALILFARKHKVPIGRVLDASAMCVTPGIFCVRMANFVNGELYGRVATEGSSFAMRFPTDEAVEDVLGTRFFRYVGGNRAAELQIQHAYGKVDYEEVLAQIPEDERTEVLEKYATQIDQFRDVRWEEVQQFAPLRHPSQIYEGVGEGLFLGLVLWTVYLLRRRNQLPSFCFAGLFLAGYGLIRFGIEYFRQPDAQFRDEGDELGTVLLGFSMGQVLSGSMVLAGLLMFTLRFALGGRGVDGDGPMGGDDGASAAAQETSA